MPTCVNRNNLGGIALPVAQANVSGTNRGTSAVTYHTSQGTYFGFHNAAGAVRAYRITPTNPPTIVFGWSVSQNGNGSPWVTTTDGTNDVIVWVVGTGGDQRLHGYNGDTGAVIYAGGGANELMTGTRQWNTGMVARGRIYFGADNKIYAFRLPAGTLRLRRLLASNFHSNIYTNCDCDWHANIDPNSHGKWESDANTQTNTHSETPHDTEAAPDSAAKAER